MSQKSILFISHNASRTGAPILLLSILKWLKNYTTISFQILLKEEGELISEFESLGTVNIFPRLIGQPLVRRIALKYLKEKLLRENIGLIYANTVTIGETLEFLQFLHCPVICHVHELEYWIQHRIGHQEFEQITNATKYYIATSNAVKNNLIESHQIPEHMIELVYGAISIKLQTEEEQQQHRERVCQQVGISPKTFIVCASGTIDWRKGPDIFIQLAQWVHKKHPLQIVHFLWIGGEQAGSRFGELWHDVKNLGMEQYVHFLGVKANPLDYFAACDVFALVSRDEPLGLVGIEAASLGKPLVCFDQAGGIQEFVEHDCGFVVPYLDIETMATRILELLESPPLRQRFGQQAQIKVQQRHDINVTAPQILSIIKKFL